MKEKILSIRFDLDDEVDRRVYQALQAVPEFLEEPDLSKAIILFVDNLVNAIGDCEDRRRETDALLEVLLKNNTTGIDPWH